MSFTYIENLMTKQAFLTCNSYKIIHILTTIRYNRNDYKKVNMHIYIQKQISMG